MLRVTRSPEPIVRGICCGSRPVYETSSVAAPAGTSSWKWPCRSVRANWDAPRTETRAPSRKALVAALLTCPLTVPAVSAAVAETDPSERPSHPPSSVMRFLVFMVGAFFFEPG